MTSGARVGRPKRTCVIASNRPHTAEGWYVGTLDGRVVTSLGCYPIRFQIDGEDLPGIAIGSVHTLSEVRGRGFAPQLIDWVERDNPGAALSVLFSDIQPEYYARIGYVLCPSLEGWVDSGKLTISPRNC